MEKRVRGAHAAAVLDRGHREPDALGIGLVVIFDPPHADRRTSIDERLAQRIGLALPRDRERTARAARRRGTQLVVLDPLVAGKDRVPPPPLVPASFELVPVGLLAAVVDESVDRARAAECLASRPHLDRTGRDPCPHHLAQQCVWHRVVVLLDLDVVVEPGAALLPCGVGVGLGRQRL